MNRENKISGIIEVKRVKIYWKRFRSITFLDSSQSVRIKKHSKLYYINELLEKHKQQ